MKISKYSSNDRIALVAIAEEDDLEECVFAGHTELAKLTVNLVHENIPDDHVFINTPNLPETILDDLKNAGIISDPILYAKSGFAEFPLVKLNEEFININK